ncbi:MAG TPA: hypothetical protein VMI11_10075 [Actinomycetes bacterium]|nr:hypothetical protein [Actinomycetes bacterium]
MPDRRYLLQDRVAEGADWALWRGADTVLHRPVAVLVVAASHPHRHAVADAAARAGGLPHPGTVHVYDVVREPDGSLLVVREWVAGRTLVDRLAEGPVEVAQACRIGAELARVLAEAHRHGVVHGQLVPADVILGDDGRIRVLGIAVDGALAGRDVDADISRCVQDARDAAAVSYAAVTGRWAGHTAQAALPAAPETDGRPLRARQVRAGVPPALDTCLAQLLESADDADQVAKELEDVERRLREDHESAATGPLSVLLSDVPGPESVASPEQPEPSPWLRRTVAVVVSAVVLGATVATASLLLHASQGGGAAAATASSARSLATSPGSMRTGSTAPVGPIEIRGVKDFDPEGNGSEKPQEVPYAVDGDLATAWHTLLYQAPDLAPKHGVGLLLDLGTEQTVGAVRVDLVGAGTDLQVRTSMSPGAMPDDYQLFGASDSSPHLVTVQAARPVRARYVLLWLTRLPRASGGYRGGVSEVSVLRG